MRECTFHPKTIWRTRSAPSPQRARSLPGSPRAAQGAAAVRTGTSSDQALSRWHLLSL